MVSYFLIIDLTVDISRVLSIGFPSISRTLPDVFFFLNIYVLSVIFLFSWVNEILSEVKNPFLVKNGFDCISECLIFSKAV